MKKSIVTLSVFSALSGLLFTSCVTENKEQAQMNLDQSAGSIAYETNSMGDAAAALLVPAKLARSNALSAASLAVTAEWSIDTANGQLIRTATGTGTEGWTGTRNDTLTFYDAQNNVIRIPQAGGVDHYKHTRGVAVSKNGHDYVGNYSMDVKITRAADTTLTFNGTQTGIFDSEYTRDVVVTNVVRKLVTAPTRSLERPTSGTIKIDRPLRTIEISFASAGASGVVKNKASGETREFSVDEKTGLVAAK